MRVFSVMSSLSLAAFLVGCASSPASNIAKEVKPQAAAGCQVATEKEVAALFDRWNASLQTGDPHKVSANYAKKSILLPTVSNKPRLDVEQKEDYFHHFLENKPVGKIDMRVVETACNTAVDSGLYTFTFGKNGKVVHARYTFVYKWEDGKWLISSHHSSAMPEKF